MYIDVYERRQKMPNLSYYCRLVSKTTALVTWHRFGIYLRRRLEISNFFDMISSECCTKTRSAPLSLSDIALHCAMLPPFPSLQWSGDCVLRANPESQNTYTCTAHHLGMVQVMRHHLCTTSISVCAYRATSHNLTSIKSANSELSFLSKPPTNSIMCVEPKLPPTRHLSKPGTWNG